MGDVPLPVALLPTLGPVGMGVVPPVPPAGPAAPFDPVVGVPV